MTVRNCTLIATQTVAIVLAWIFATGAYEVDTHRVISSEAVNQSVLNAGYLEEQLAIARDSKLRWGRESRSIGGRDGWIAEGSKREDDRLRYLNHFLDPSNGNAGLFTRCGGGFPAVDWAFEQPSEPDDFKFAWLDARQYFLTALTGQRPQDREADMARTFRTLGDVVHLVQDMGSPEHTRNDIHAGRSVTVFGVYLCGAESLFEVHIDEIRDRLTYGGYAVPSFAGFRNFWTTGSGLGFAEFTNRNFVSKSSNFTASVEGNTGQGYLSPRLSLLLRDDTNTAALDAGIPLSGPVTFFGNYVDDRVTGQNILNRRMTTYSLFDRDLKARGKQEIFSLNRFNIEEAARIVLPRAVGYSAGLLNYFFRGRLEPVFMANPTAPATSLLKVVNRSEVDPLGSGTLSVHVDDASGVRAKVGEASIGATQPGLTSEAGIVVDPSLEAQAVTVVYQGALGGEAGAVIGKVQPAAAVEQIFRGASDWMLRTATGIFPLGLGLPPSGPAVVKWGDVDNTLVTQSFFDVLDMRFQAYRINRAEGSRTVPLTAVRTVDLISLGDPVTLGPTPIDLGTTWTDQRVVNYEQTVVGLARDTNGFVSFLGTDPGYTTTMDRTRPLRLTMPLDDQSPDYDWTLLDFALNRAGQVVGQVVVSIGTPPLVKVPVFRHRGDGTIGDSGQIGSVDFFTGLRDECWFIVNLTNRTVIGKTCDDTVQTSHRAHQQGTVVYDLRDVGNWVFLFTVAPLGDEPEVGTFAIDHGVTGVSRTGVYRREWTTAGYGTVQVGSQASSGLVAFSTNFYPARRLRAVVRGSSTSHDVEVVTILGELLRSDGPAEGYTVLAADSRFVEEREFIQGWQWRPLTGGLTPLASLSVPAEPGVFVTTHLVDANRTAGMFLTTIFTFPRQRQTRLVSPARELVFSGALESQYDLLEPGLLYGLIDFRFHRQTQALEALTAPDPLAAGGPTAGTYHVVGRR